MCDTLGEATGQIEVREYHLSVVGSPAPRNVEDAARRAGRAITRRHVPAEHLLRAVVVVQEGDDTLALTVQSHERHAELDLEPARGERSREHGLHVRLADEQQVRECGASEAESVDAGGHQSGNPGAPPRAETSRPTPAVRP